jgi:Phage tail lysozyme
MFGWMRRRVVMTLLDNGWTEEQAKALIDCLKLTGGVPDWKPEHIQKLYDWCKSQEKDPKTIEGQLEFVAYELCNTCEAMGTALKQANTIEEAKKAIEPYVRALQQEPEWFRALKSHLGEKGDPFR